MVLLRFKCNSFWIEIQIQLRKKSNLKTVYSTFKQQLFQVKRTLLPMLNLFFKFLFFSYVGSVLSPCSVLAMPTQCIHGSWVRVGFFSTSLEVKFFFYGFSFLTFLLISLKKCLAWDLPWLNEFAYPTKKI